ncbi:MAG: hypothetical protein KDA78_15870, partial [Planctomycetaceae bacterium]|nr:hypothetical protein [Planctomycetaceae bacterium]
MQGAAWKLTALAASLAVGFFGLMQVQQKLSPKPEQLFSEDDSSLMPDEESTESRMFGKDDFAVNEQQNEPREDPFFRAEPVNGSNPQPVKDGFVPVTQRKETAADPFENRTTAQHAPQPTPENDPFAGYQPPAQEVVDQFQNRVQQANAQVQTAMNETAQQGEQLVDDWQGKILQTANEVREDLNKVRNAFDPFTAQAEPPQNDGPAEQERPDGPFPVINPAVEMQPPQQIPQIELTLNSKRTPRPGSAPTPKSDAPAPFFANETEAKPIQITPAPAMDETPAADPFTTTADLPQVTPQPAAVKPVASSEAQPAALQLTPPATSNTPAPAPEVQPETNTPAPASGNPFFPEFSNTTPQEMKENQDEPYRLVPQFNNAQPESTPAPEPATNTEPAPFALTPPDNAPVMESEPANPFSASEPIQPEEALPVIEPQPIPQVQPEPTPAPANPAPPFSFSPTPEPEPTPAPAPFQLQPEPAPSPGTARIQITPAPLKVEENNAPTDEMLIGSARVEHEATETAMQPKVVLNKSAPDNAVLGQPLIYSIEIENTGDVAVKEVRVEDKFPAGTRLTGTIPRAELVEKTLVWKFDELKPSERKKILVRVVPIESGKVGSVSTVSYKSVVTTQTMVTAPKLELTLLSTNEVAIGEPVEVKFVVKNSGAGVASDVILRNLISKGLEHPAGADLEYEI